MDNMDNMLKDIGKRAKAASQVLLDNLNLRNKALLEIDVILQKNIDFILKANEKDLSIAKENKMKESMFDRLTLSFDRIKAIANCVKQVAKQDDPLNRLISGHTLENGLKIEKITCPMGIIGMIYESRPNVTVDAAAISIKAGSACILRGGKEAINTNKALASLIRTALSNVGLSEDTVILIEDTNRQSATDLMQLTDYLDVLIPRGSKNLIDAVAQNSKVPVIITGAGNNHAYIDKEADLEKAVNIVYNGKTSRPSVCNALETMLIHESVANKFLPMIEEKFSEKEVVIHGDDKTCAILGKALLAEDLDDTYSYEYLSLNIASKVVSSMDEAIAHIRKYSTGHSEVIITENYSEALRFVNSIDSACVYINASTRFTDGEQFGLGAEIGISTGKLQARGPMGVNEIVTNKYIIHGNGQIRV